MKTSKTIRTIPVDAIVKGKNYRTPKNIEQLAISIKSEGQIVPIHVTKKKDKFIVLDGFRRFGAVEYANKELGADIKEMNALIVEENYSEEERALMQMVLNESLQSPLEKAIKISELIEQGMQQQRLADAFGVNKSYISQVKKKILPDDIFKAYLNNEIILVLNSDNERKYFSTTEKLNEFIGSDIDLLKKVKKISPDEERINFSALDSISEVYYKLVELDKLDEFRDLIATFQKKNIKDKKTIDKYCNKILLDLSDQNPDEGTKTKPEDKVMIVKKVTSILSKYKSVDSSVIDEINRSLEELKIPFTITFKNK